MVLLHGLPLVAHAVRGLLDAGRVRHVVVAAPPDHVSQVSMALSSHPPVTVVTGGGDRTESVRLGLAAALARVPDATIVLVHDVARALTPASLVRSVTDAVVDTPDRTELRVLQSPQGFAVDVLRRAGGELAKVDVPVHTVPGDVAGMK